MFCIKLSLLTMIFYIMKEFYITLYWIKKNMAKDKYDLSVNEQELQTILDSLSNTIFNEEIKEDARKSNIVCSSCSFIERSYFSLAILFLIQYKVI